MTTIEKLMLLFAEARANKRTDSLVEQMFRKTLEQLQAHSEEELEEIADTFDGSLHYNNFLTYKESENAVQRLRNHDGSERRKWDAPKLFSVLKDNNLPAEQEGYFNKWALYYTMNLVSSDQCENLSKWSGGDEKIYLSMCYDMSVAKLTDIDKPKFVRWYAGY